MNIFKKLPQIAVKALAASALLLATALGSVAVTASVAGAAVPTTFSATQVGTNTVVFSWTGDASAANTTLSAKDTTTSVVTSCSVTGNPAGIVTCQATGLTIGDTYSFTLVETDTSGLVTTVLGAANGAPNLLIQNALAKAYMYNNGSAGIYASFSSDGSSTGYGVAAANYDIAASATAVTTQVTINTFHGTVPAAGAELNSVAGASPGISVQVQNAAGVTKFSGTLVSATAGTTHTTVISVSDPLGVTPGTTATADAALVALTDKVVFLNATCLVTAGAAGATVGCNLPVSPTPNTLPGVVAGVTYSAIILPTFAGSTITTAVVAGIAAPQNATLTYSATTLNATVKDLTGGRALITFAADGVATSYHMSAQGNDCYVATSATVPGLLSCTISGLTSGSVTFTLAGTGAGETLTGSATATISTAMAAPTVVLGSVNAAGTSYSATVSFTADGVAGSYLVTYGTDASVAANDVTTGCPVANTATPPTGTVSCTVTGLTAGTYYFVVTPDATDTATKSAPSLGLVVPSNYTTTISVAQGPISDSVAVSFQTDAKGTKYVVGTKVNTIAAPAVFTASPLTCVITLSSAPVNLTPETCYVTGLTKGLTYQFNVTVSGNSDNSGSSAFDIVNTYTNPLSALSAPSAVAGVATKTGATATVSFTSDGVSYFYNVTYGTDASVAANDLTPGCTVANTVALLSGTQSCTIKGLTAGTTYYFVVTSLAADGITTNNSSGISNTAFVATTKIQGVSVTSAGSGSAAVSWTSDGAATGYQAVAALNGLPTSHYCTVSSASAIAAGKQTCTITGLTNGFSYNFVVAPVGGYSSISSPSPTWVAGSAPLATPSLTWAASGALTATFTADGVSNFYVVQSIQATGAGSPALGSTCTAGNSNTVPTGVLTCTLTGLTNGDAYVAYVSPYGSIYSSSSAIMTIPVLAAPYSAPGAPAVTATALTSTTVSVAFTAPVVTGGSVIGGYLISGTSTDGTSSLVCGAGALTAGTVVCTGAKPGTTYKISVYAGGPFGNSAAGTASVTTPAATLLTVGASFTKGTATLTASAKSALTTLVSSLHDGASITIRGWGATKALATARANAVASFIMSSGAAVHTTVIGIVSKASDAKVYQTA